MHEILNQLKKFARKYSVNQMQKYQKKDIL